jgi:hypothetical protein
MNNLIAYFHGMSHRALFIFFILFSITGNLYSQCPSGQYPLQININPDSYPNETTWSLFVDNILTNNGTTNGLNSCIDTNSCIRFEIYDSYGDGMCCGYGLGSYNVLWNGDLVAEGGEFQFQANHSFNCDTGTICENPISITLGNHVAPTNNTYFTFTPDSSGNYKISTCGLSNCNTQLWIYDNCMDVDVSSNNGALYYNDDYCANQAEIIAFLGEGIDYIIRVGSLGSGSCGIDIPFNVEFDSQLSSVLPIVKLTTLNASINNDIKVPVYMEIIDNGAGELNFLNQEQIAYEGTILTEWQGFSGPSYPKKNYDFDLIDQNGNKIDTSLLGLPSENDWIFKAEYLDNSLLINSFTYEFARRMGNYAPRTQLCELFLDGNYIGVYTLTEKVKRDKNRVDISKLTSIDTSGIELTGGYIIEMNINGDPGAWNSNYPPINSATCSYPVEFKYVYPKPDSILVSQSNYIKLYVDSFENSLNSSSFQDPIEGYRKFIDVGTFIDFLIVNEFSMNYDSYGRSTYMFKHKENKGGKLCIGPPWDYDRAMADPANSGWVWQNTHFYWPYPFWWSKFYTDPTYKHELACRWLNLRQDIFRTSEFHNFIDSLGNLLSQGPAERNFAIWQTLGNQSHSQKVESLKTLLADRLTWMDQNLSGFGAETPLISIPSDTIICENSIYYAPYDSSYSYNWVPGPETPEIIFPSSGFYQLKVRDEFGCLNILPINVTLSIPNPDFTISQYIDESVFYFQSNATEGECSWDFGDNTYQMGGNSVSHTYALSGSYSVELTITDSLGCTKSSSQFLFCTDGNIQFISSPNPTQNELILSHNIPLNEDFEIILVDVTGKKIAEWKNPQSPFSFSMSNYSNGIYYINCNLKNEKGFSKIVKY